MALKSFFEVPGIKLENGSSVFSGSYDPRTPPTENLDVLNSASEGSIFIRTSGDLFKKQNSRWLKLETSFGTKKSVSSNDTLLIENHHQYVVIGSEFQADGDIVIEGNGELIIHE